MAKKTASPESAYGTKLKFSGVRSNHPVKSRYMACALAMIFGIIGANQFYLRNFVRGFLKILFTVVFVVLDVLLEPPFILIPVVLSVITGFIYLLQNDETFAKNNHVRVI
ncbi:MAG: TM2 domain-containing protein [Clostridia bacterium]|nr:TM2 domain-containing protein [Clostridia bacterium]